MSLDRRNLIKLRSCCYSYPLEERLSVGAPDVPGYYGVTKMRWGGSSKAPDLSTIVYKRLDHPYWHSRPGPRIHRRSSLSTGLAEWPLPSENQ